MAHLGFVGLGVMGGPMAGHLVRAGHTVTVWNRTPSKSEPLRQLGATVANSLPELAAASDAIFLCVGRTEDVEECLSELTKGAKPGTLFVDHSTIDPVGAKRIAASLAGQGFRFVDAPVTGGYLGAINGTLMIFCGGSEADVAEAKELMKPYTKRAERAGDSGAGQWMKAANQIAVGGALLALCESLSFAEKAGLDIVLTREMISGGAGGSWAYEHYGAKILKSDWTPGFSVKNQRKDFGYCADAAEQIGASIPGTKLVDELLLKLEAKGRSEDTTAALIDVYREGDA